MQKFAFQGIKTKNYFEGWYFRFTNNVNYAFIFAITNNTEDPHAFIQVFNENMEECNYKRFDLSLFHFTNDEVHIGENLLSLQQVKIHIDDFNLDLAFDKTELLEKSSMGYLSKAPLDCFQEVIMLGGHASGMLNNQEVDGTIYIEKTYGNKFPKRWIWLQSNHSKNDSSISFSVGYIPFFKLLVKGWLLVLKTEKFDLSFHSLDGSSLKIGVNDLIIKSFNYKVIIQYNQAQTIQLVGPKVKAHMSLDVFESLTSTATVSVYKKKQLIFQDNYSNVGLERMMDKNIK